MLERNCLTHLDKFECELNALEKYFKAQLDELRFSGVILFGSIIRKEYLDLNNSDIDVVAYSDLFSRESASFFLNVIEKKGGDYADKSPRYIEDSIAPRIEYFLKINDVVFDINIFSTKLPGWENHFNDSVHDSLEIIVGAMYQNATLLYGESPYKNIIEKEFLPFYSDELRKSRLALLRERIKSILFKLEEQYEKDNDIIYYIFKLRSYIVKYLFIYVRKYPVDTTRYLRRQLHLDIHLPSEYIDALLLDNDNIIYNFINVSKKILKEYN